MKKSQFLKMFTILAFKVVLLAQAHSDSAPMASDRIEIKTGMKIEDFDEVVKSLPERNKFAFSPSKGLVISRVEEDGPKHDELLGISVSVEDSEYSDGNFSGGYISFKYEEVSDAVSDDEEQRERMIVELDNFSGRLCPSFKSLSKVSAFLSEYFREGDHVLMTYNRNSEKCDPKNLPWDQ